METLFTDMTAGGGAEALLSFLVDELRPRLAAEFRFDGDHGLVGHSGGGHFVGSVTRMAQLLLLRDYPSLGLTTRLYPGQTHGSALPYALTDGLRTLYPQSRNP